jgi:hypothetical protein
MNAANPDWGSRKTSGKRLQERNSRLGREATWVSIDLELEVRSRLACIVDELDRGDHAIATANLELLLADLDEARR